MAPERDESCFRSGAARVTGVGDLIEGPSRATIIAAAVSGFGRIEIGSAVEARSLDRASNPAGSRSIAQELCHAKAMEREDRRQVGTAKDIVGHHGRREHNPWPSISKDRHAKIEVLVVLAGDDLIPVLREQGPAPKLVPDRVTALSVDWSGQVAVAHAGNAERLHQMRPDDEEMLENRRQVAERRRIDRDNVLLRGS